MINKKKYGQFFTNDIISKFMATWVMANNPETVLEPAAGDGAFIRAILKINNSIRIKAFDIDNNMCKKLEKFIERTCIINQDYLTTNLNKFDAIICNPPYNKFQKILNRKDLLHNFNQFYNIKLNGYSNLCMYFLIKSMQELSQNGRCAYIIPYEFLNTGYGKIIKEYFIKTKILHSIIKFDNKLNLFEDAITTSCILFIENNSHESVNFISIKNLEELNSSLKFKNNFIYKYESLTANDKWLKYFDSIDDFNINNLIKLKDIGQVKRGIATGNNAYFVLNQQKIADLQLSQEVCLPCITKSADISNLIFDNAEFAKLKCLNKKVFLFNGKKAIRQSDYRYIALGEQVGVNKTYLTSRRTPWYSIEEKYSAPILFSVFCRNKLKIIRNEAMIKTLTTFHGFYFHNQVSENYINIFFCYLLTPVAQKILFKNKREYGAGLDKFEPNDLNDAHILNINKITKEDQDKILEIYKRLKKEKTEQLIFHLNNIFSYYVA